MLRCKMHDFQERTLRDVIQSPYGQPCIDAFFATLREVRAIRVQRKDGTVTPVTTEAEARELLMAFGWVPPKGG